MNVAERASPRASILVVEDSSVFREMQGLLLGQAGYDVSAHESPQTALEIGAKQLFDLVIIDYELPQMNGQEFMHALRKIQPDIAVIFVSGSLTLELAIQLSSEGVAGIFNKPANPKTLLEKVNETLARNSARDTAARVGSNSQLGGRANGSTSALYNSPTTELAADQTAFKPRFLPATSQVFRDFSSRIWKVRDFRSVLLLQGEPGSPFESLARELTEISVFREGPIMVCGAAEFDARRLIEVLAPSLLSHDAGTLVVSGVESFNAEQQVMLNNLMSGRDVFLPFARRFRLVLAASGRFSDRVENGSFDETLYYKISSLSLTVPSLREMPGDIVAIAGHIRASHGESQSPGEALAFAPDAIKWLEAQAWPENYDQLYRTILGAIPHAKNSQITSAALAATLLTAAPSKRVASNVPAQSENTRASRSPNTTRPPFPFSSDLAKETAKPVVPAAQTKIVAPAPSPTAKTATPATVVAKAPAGRLFSRPATKPVRPLAARSVFRPASASYQFTERLAECLAQAEPNAAA
jgi:DNA-binding NtrC family response regulator